MAFILRNAVYVAAVNAGVRPAVPHLPDAAYALPSSSWIRGEFAAWLASALKALKLGYTDDGWDCDNFSEFARVFAQVAHRRTANSDDALAFGVFEYLRTDLSGHSICCAITSELPDQLLFFEPQPNFGALNPVILTPEEIASCIYLRM